MLITLIVVEIIILVFLGYLIFKKGEGVLAAPIYPGAQLIGENKVEKLKVKHYVTEAKQGDVAIFYNKKLPNFYTLSNHFRGDSLFFSIINPVVKEGLVELGMNVSSVTGRDFSDFESNSFIGVEVTGIDQYEEFNISKERAHRGKTLINIWSLE